MSSGKRSYKSSFGKVASKAKQYAFTAKKRKTSYQKMIVGMNEPKYVDVSFTSYNMDTTGSIALLNTVAQGASTSQRIGKKWVMTSIQGRGFSTSNSATITCQGSWLLVYDKRPTGSLPAITDILVSADSEAMNNDNNTGRFKILKRVDRSFTGNTSAATTVTDSTLYEESFYLKLNNLPVVNKAAGTGAIADIEEGALYIVTVGHTAAGTSAATHGMGYRIRYHE